MATPNRFHPLLPENPGFADKPRTARRFFRGLKNEQNVFRKLRLDVVHIMGEFEHHRHMPVVTAGVHLAGM